MEGKCCSHLQLGQRAWLVLLPGPSLPEFSSYRQAFLDQDKKNQGLDIMWFFIMASATSSVNVETSTECALEVVSVGTPARQANPNLYQQLDRHSRHSPRLAGEEGCSSSSPSCCHPPSALTGKSSLHLFTTAPGGPLQSLDPGGSLPPLRKQLQVRHPGTPFVPFLCGPRVAPGPRGRAALMGSQCPALCSTTPQLLPLPET